MAESICKFLEKRGHIVTRLKDIIPTDSPDPMVAKVAQERDEILLTGDCDFGTIAAPNRQGKRFKKLSRIWLNCEPAKAEKRLAAALALIEFEYAAAQVRGEKRIIVEIKNTVIRVVR